MKMPVSLVAALSLVLAAANSFAVLSISKNDSTSGDMFDNVATALRTLGPVFWDQDDALFNPENVVNGSLLFTTSIDYGMGMTDVDWIVKSPYGLNFKTDEMKFAGIYSEAGDRNMLRAHDADGMMNVVHNKQADYDTKTFTIESDQDMIGMELFNLSQGTGGFNSSDEIIFGEAMIEGKYFGIFVFDDRFPSLDNHDDFIGLVDVSPVPEPATIIGLVALGFIGLTIRNKFKANRK